MTTIKNQRPLARRLRATLGKVGRILFLASAVLFAVVPILWAVLTSLKSPPEVALYPPTFLPRDWTLENYRGAVFYNDTFLHYLFNTAVIVVVTALICLVLSAHAAYSVARYRFRFSGGIMFASRTATGSSLSARAMRSMSRSMTNAASGRPAPR